MASNFKCRHCDAIYDNNDHASICCTDVIEQNTYECPHCNETYEEMVDALNCCGAPIELYDIEDFKPVLTKIWTNGEFELLPDLFTNIDETGFSFFLPFDVNVATFRVWCRCYRITSVEIFGSRCLNFRIDKYYNGERALVIMQLIKDLFTSSQYRIQAPGHITTFLSIKDLSIYYQVNSVIKEIIQKEAEVIVFNIKDGRATVLNKFGEMLLIDDHLNHRPILCIDPRYNIQFIE